MNIVMPVLPFILGFILDLILGDPQNWPHPVRWMGGAINFLQQKIRLIFLTESALRWGGLVLWLIMVLGSFFLTYIILLICYQFSFWLGFCIEAILAYLILATKCLKDAAMGIYNVLNTGTLQQARTQVSYIVGRDTSQLSSEQITRATVETVAENTVDGVIAPLFYLFIGGVPLAMAYKAINTLDSMVGYQTPKYQAIGYFSAKLDDLFNWFPARLSWILITVASAFLKLDTKSAFTIGWRDRFQHKSPNCGWPEATVAGALGISLGGPNVYFGNMVEKPWIGENSRNIEPEDIKKSIALMYGSALLALILFVVIYFVITIT